MRTIKITLLAFVLSLISCEMAPVEPSMLDRISKSENDFALQNDLDLVLTPELQLMLRLEKLERDLIDAT